MRTAGRVLLIIGSLLLALLVAAAWFLGPTLGVLLRGQPFFLLPPGPERYAAVVLDQAQRQGIHGMSPEFAAARAEAEEQAAAAEDIADVYDSLNAALVAAGGKHSRFITPADAVGMAEENSALPTVARQGSVLVATVPPFDSTNDVQEYADTLAHGLTAENTTCGVVVDLRDNTGGDMGPMVAGLSPLLTDGVALSFATSDYSSPVTVDANSVSGGGTGVETSGGKLDVPVAVLVNGMTASSGEATLLAFRGLPDSRSFGTPTAGYATANTSFRMPDGAVVLLTAAHMQDRTGVTYGDEPVHPDVVTDDPSNAALDWLATEYGCR